MATSQESFLGPQTLVSSQASLAVPVRREPRGEAWKERVGFHWPQRHSRNLQIQHLAVPRDCQRFSPTGFPKAVLANGPQPSFSQLPRKTPIRHRTKRKGKNHCKLTPELRETNDNCRQTEPGLPNLSDAKAALGILVFSPWDAFPMLRLPKV